MEYRYFGQTGLKISQLGMGTMTFGGDADEESARALFARCRDAGINFFDCANVYAGGRSEEILGRLIQSCREQVVISSKGAFPTGPDVNARGATRYNLIKAVEASLRRLRTERIDIYYVHGFDPDTALDETLRVLEDLVRQGKVLYLGVSNFSAWQTMKALGIQERHAWARLAGIQPIYNLLKRQAEVEILPMAAAEQLAVTPYNPLAAGLLTGKYGASRRPEGTRLSTNPMYRARYGEPAYAEIAERFVAFARERGYHPVALAISWAGSHPAVTAPLLGARTRAQLDECLQAAEVRMTLELRAEICALSPPPPPATDRNEEAGPHRHAAR